MQMTWMKTALFGAMVAVSCVSLAQPGNFLADRHAARGVACASCHGDKAPTAGAKVPSSACESCHGDIEKVGAQTRQKNPKLDPHFNNHLIGVSCLECHQGHQAGKNVCADCHHFKLKTP